MLENKSLTEPMLELLSAMVKGRLNLLISGGTGAGKTTVLNVLSGYIPNNERVVAAQLRHGTLTRTTNFYAVAGPNGRWYGVYPALVSGVKDPDGQGRVEVTLPWAPDSGSGEYKAWARLATMMAGNNRGSWFVPDEHDEVLVGFEGGDPRRPYVLGAMWNGQDRAPTSMDRRPSSTTRRRALRMS